MKFHVKTVLCENVNLNIFQDILFQEQINLQKHK